MSSDVGIVTAPESFQELFIISPPHAGTTVMAKLLLGSERFWSRMPNAEADTLPESKPFIPKNPWNERARWDWPALKPIWEEGRPDGSILLEKSPAIMLWVEELLQHWPRAFFIINMRDPYAQVASYLRARDNSDEQIRQSVLRWAKRARIQAKNLKRLQGRCVVTSYEAFTGRPRKLVRRLERVFGPLGVNVGRPLEVKLYQAAPISNHNARQIATLTSAQLELTRRLLAEHASQEMEFWGYAAAGPLDPAADARN